MKKINEKEKSKEGGITEGMNLVKGTFETSREEWEKKARADTIQEVRDKIENYVCKECGGICFDRENILRILTEL